MPEFVINSGGYEGLGDTAPSLLSLVPGAASPSLTSAPWANTCGSSLAAFILNAQCWGNSYSDWEAAYNSFSGLNIPAPAPLSVPVTALADPNAVLGDTTGQAAQALSNAQIAASQAAIAAANPSIGSNQQVGLCPAWCQLLDCDANCNLSMDGTNLAWLVGSAALLFVLVKMI